MVACDKTFCVSAGPLEDAKARLSRIGLDYKITSISLYVLFPLFLSHLSTVDQID